jgi:hypothetical protein
LVFEEKASHAPEIECGEEIREVEVQNVTPPLMVFGVVGDPTVLSEPERHGLRSSASFNLGKAAIQDMREVGLELFELRLWRFNRPDAAGVM